MTCVKCVTKSNRVACVMAQNIKTAGIIAGNYRRELVFVEQDVLDELNGS